MKGLLTKDLALLLARKKSFIFLAIWAIVMTFTLDGSFTIGWMTIVAAFFAISSLAYDEYDNCFPFLMSLPIDGKTYAKEKYLFGFLLGLGAWLFATITYFIAIYIKTGSIDFTNSLMMAISFIPIFMLLIDFSLPINLKFGSERGRVVTIIIWGIIYLAISLSNNIFGNVSIALSYLDGENIFIIGIILAIIFTLISMMLSIRIMEKKEY